MKLNVGNADRVFRVVLGLAIIGAGFYFQSYWGAIGLIFVVTAAMGWCPIYATFGIGTCKVKDTQAKA
jgi:hypothetical protein